MTERSALTAEHSATPATTSGSLLPGSGAGPDGGHYFAGVLGPAGIVLAIDRNGVDDAEWADAVGGPIWAARCWGGAAEIVEPLRRAVRAAAEGVAGALELDLPPGVGCSARVVDVAIRPARDSSGAVATLIIVARDLSARKEAEAELARRNLELQALYENIRELDSLKMQFFANASHELRTPLALILGSSERLITDVDLSDETRHNAEIVARNARLLLRHISDLLDIAKLEARKMHVHHEDVDLSQLVRDTAEHFDALARERKVAYVVDTPESLGASVDAEKVQRVVLNVLSNAFKFTPPGGSIRVALTGPPGQAEASGGTAGDAVPRATIAVLDSGAGVPLDQRETIFERFRQGMVGATRRFGGTGLGLAIARDFVELHGGTITAGEAPGGGAAFTIDLPLFAPRPSASRPFTPPEPGIAIDMARQTIDELRMAASAGPAQRPGHRRGGAPDQIG